MDNVQETVTSGRKHYKNGSFKETITADTIRPLALDTYIKSSLLTAAESEVFEPDRTCFLEAEADIATRKHLLAISNTLFSIIGGSIIEVFKAGMITRGLYDPQCTAFKKLYAIDFAQGQVSVEECESSNPHLIV